MNNIENITKDFRKVAKNFNKALTGFAAVMNDNKAKKLSITTSLTEKQAIELNTIANDWVMVIECADLRDKGASYQFIKTALILGITPYDAEILYMQMKKDMSE